MDIVDKILKENKKRNEHFLINLNTDKYIKITITRNRQNFNCNYYYDINNKTLGNASKVKNFIFFSDLTFSEHINEIHYKAIHVFGFLHCNFCESSLITYFFLFLVRPILNYGSIICSPQQ